MRTAVVLGCSILAAACGGASQPTATGPGNTSGDGVGAAAPAGTTSLPGLDWGASSAAVQARYPGATITADGVVARGAVDGRPATTVFTIGDAGLEHVKTVWTAGYPSMQACARDWDVRRREVDARLGESSAENLAAFWDTATATITLFCDPRDDDAAELAITYGPRLEP